VLGVLLLAACWCLAPLAANGQTTPFRGLWVGEVRLNYATEVTVGLDENNVAVAPDPKVPTPTKDQANLRLILHVNGAGQVSLLKDVAILNRRSATNDVLSESDIALVTDERLYGQFPPQPAIRHASAVFDFGDSLATDALTEVMNRAAEAAGALVFSDSSNLSVSANRVALEDAAAGAALSAAQPVVDSADVAAAFAQFLLGTNFNSAKVTAIAQAANPTNAAQSALAAATNLQNGSFYGDSRAVEMIQSVLGALCTAGTNEATRIKVAQNTASAFADVANNYHRFIGGKLFGDMMLAAAVTAANAATNAGTSIETIRALVNGNTTVMQARSNALALRVTTYTDTRAPDAVELTLEAIIAAAAAALPANPLERSMIQLAGEQAGRGVLSSNVIRYPVAAETPTLEYTDFVRGTGAFQTTAENAQFEKSAEIAARAAAQGAISEKRNNSLFLEASIKNAAKVAAAEALRTLFGTAARAVRTELPMAGGFGPGVGDARLTWDIKQTNGPALAPAQSALTARLDLPANHPTNPFRHRRHPDHTSGLDITRHLRLDFDAGATESLPRAGYGVDRISGVYREEILGLHKPLGPSSDIGLRVEGRFELNRISLTDVLNAL
jgi:hypothetical protein